ncbi:MAG: ACT domain-containing protein [Bryobacteraceae bacterium]
MKLHQLSLFLENKPGQLLDPCKRLASAGINIRTLSVADTQQFGILRLIVSDWQKARTVLQEAGYVTTATEVVAVEVPDRPGGLAEVLEALENCEVNIEYMYAFTFGRADRAVIIFRFDRPDEAIARLQAAGINVVESIEVYNRIEA